MTTKVDVTIVGMGIVGVATANELTLHKPDLKILLIEKEAEPASHQTVWGLLLGPFDGSPANHSVVKRLA